MNEINVAAAQSEHLAMVAEWFRKFGVPIAERPTVPGMEVQCLRVDLIEEEFREYREADLADDIVGVADAIADLLYVVYGAALAWGIPIDECFREVHKSNMGKIWADGKVHRRKDGKILKPPTFRPPDLATILRQHGADL